MVAKAARQDNVKQGGCWPGLGMNLALGVNPSPILVA